MSEVKGPGTILVNASAVDERASELAGDVVAVDVGRRLRGDGAARGGAVMAGIAAPECGRETGVGSG